MTPEQERDAALVSARAWQEKAADLEKECQASGSVCCDSPGCPLEQYAKMSRRQLVEELINVGESEEGERYLNGELRKERDAALAQVEKLREAVARLRTAENFYDWQEALDLALAATKEKP